MPAWGVLIRYGAIAGPLAMLVLPVFIYLPSHYADAMGLGLGVVGPLLLAARLWDGISDPLIGAASDGLRLPLGRRRPWILIGAPLVLVAVWRLFLPPETVSASYLLVWTMVLYTGWTLVIVPLNAWGAELTPSYHGRSRVAGVREGFVVAGTVTALALPFVFGVTDAEQTGDALAVIGVALMILIPVTLALLMWRVPDAPPATPVPFRPWRVFTVLADRQYRPLLASHFLNSVSNALPATLFLLFVANALGAGDLAGGLLLAYFGSGLVLIPVWLWLSRRLDKKLAWQAAMIMSVLAFCLVPFAGPDSLWVYGIVVVVSGAALGADLVLPASMLADVVSLDGEAEPSDWRPGAGRAGQYFALWGMASKLALALGVGIAFPVLDWAGFIPGAGPEGAGIVTLTVLYAGVPVILKLGAIVMIVRYDIDARRFGPR